jgi:hypothetical protein
VSRAAKYNDRAVEAAITALTKASLSCMPVKAISYW